MTQASEANAAANGGAGQPVYPQEVATPWLSRTFLLTDMPVGLMLLLTGLGLPRTILADLDIVAPESSLLYYVLALVPFAAWFGVAVGRATRKPVMDFLVLGVVYGLSLVVVHQVLWNAAQSLGHKPPASAVNFANSFDPAFHDLALRAYTSMIAMGIGLGTGLAAGLVAVIAHVVRRSRR